jgi:hypothetical protein
MAGLAPLRAVRFNPQLGDSGQPIAGTAFGTTELVSSYVCAVDGTGGWMEQTMVRTFGLIARQPGAEAE